MFRKKPKNTNRDFQLNEAGQRTLRADAFLRQGQIDLAFREAVRAIQLVPDGAEAYVARGICWFEKGSVRKAMIDLNTAVRYSSHSQFPYIIRAVLQLYIGNWDRAIEDSGKALTEDYLSPEEKGKLYAVRCWAYMQKGDSCQVNWIKEIGIYSQLLMIRSKSNPRLVHVSPALAVIGVDLGLEVFHLSDGFKYSDQAEYGKAISSFTEALKIRSLNNLSWYKRGFAFLQLGMTTEAIGDFNRSLSLDRQYKFPYYYRGIAYKIIDNEIAAESDFRAYLSLGGDKEHTTVKYIDKLITQLTSG